MRRRGRGPDRARTHGYGPPGHPSRPPTSLALPHVGPRTGIFQSMGAALRGRPSTPHFPESPMGAPAHVSRRVRCRTGFPRLWFGPAVTLGFVCPGPLVAHQTDGRPVHHGASPRPEPRPRMALVELHFDQSLPDEFEDRPAPTGLPAGDGPPFVPSAPPGIPTTRSSIRSPRPQSVGQDFRPSPRPLSPASRLSSRDAPS